jgi:hypothetical protein
MLDRVQPATENPSIMKHGPILLQDYALDQLSEEKSESGTSKSHNQHLSHGSHLRDDDIGNKDGVILSRPSYDFITPSNIRTLFGRSYMMYLQT